MAEAIKRAMERLTGIGYPKPGDLRVAPVTPEPHVYADDGRTPNNLLPLLVYRQVMAFESGFDPAAQFEVLFQSHGWKDSWRDSMYRFNHFHTRTHEVLGLARGRLLAEFGGSKGEDIELGAGDVVLIPAGVGHKCRNASRDILIVGAYPDGGEYDEPRPREISHRKALDRIARVPVPSQDPVYGQGGMLELWR